MLVVFNSGAIRIIYRHYQPSNYLNEGSLTRDFNRMGLSEVGVELWGGAPFPAEKAGSK